jgi:hypothetical protein
LLHKYISEVSQYGLRGTSSNVPRHISLVGEVGQVVWETRPITNRVPSSTTTACLTRILKIISLAEGIKSLVSDNVKKSPGTFLIRNSITIINGPPSPRTLLKMCLRAHEVKIGGNFVFRYLGPVASSVSSIASDLSSYPARSSPGTHTCAATTLATSRRLRHHLLIVYQREWIHQAYYVHPSSHGRIFTVHHILIPCRA